MGIGDFVHLDLGFGDLVSLLLGLGMGISNFKIGKWGFLHKKLGFGDWDLSHFKLGSWDLPGVCPQPDRAQNKAKQNQSGIEEISFWFWFGAWAR